MVRLKRAFDKASADDGKRVLVDRLWPRGIRKEALSLYYWAKELAPSNELREQYHRDPKRWGLFQAHMRAELKASANAMDTLAALAKMAKTETITLVYASREPIKNNATVVKDLLESFPV